MRRPLIAIPGRFSASASALRFGALVNARRLLDAVYRAGGEPVTVYPYAPSGMVSPAEVGARLAWADGLLLPGGGDLDPRRYGQPPGSSHLYDIDAEQDGFDLAAAAWAAQERLPVLAICRGMQVVNTVRGGDLQQHMPVPHRHVTQQIRLDDDTLTEVLGAVDVDISCYHHQRIGRLGVGLRAAALAGDGTVEAVVAQAADSWLVGVQWHPEDTADTDAAQLALFRSFVDQTRQRTAVRA